MNRQTRTMENVINVASYIAERYQSTFGEKISEMKLHKLLYFTQRECLIQLGKPLFAEQFLAWRYGPVMVEIRPLFAQGLLTKPLSIVSQKEYSTVFDFVFKQYAPKDAWSLSRLSHNEYSWRKARHGLNDDENGNSPLLLEDIRRDAAIAKIRRMIVDRMNKSEKV